ncbi:MAG TPA: C40 family peptidase [Intrasporangium sp.]|uniref:C40 family peptidase n=1 Tax=Intrasporangium sp. TaxID=1925024 RepID=UPI002D771B69|nr:C40 family peptidase [Intrasporangium sp.]HET7398772.1 C40 family peptidase [Intrasporangium sp.]
MPQNAPGRHRAPGRYNPLAELTLIAKATAQPAVKGAALLAASGGLVAGLAAPAGAAEGSRVVAETAAAEAPAAKPLAPRVIEDVILKEQRAAEAKRRAEAAAKARAAAEARRAAEQRAAQERAAAQQANASRRQQGTTTSRSTTRTAVPVTSAVKSTRNTYSAPAPAPSASGIVGIAQSMSGVPYVWGGTTPSGFDCSGFTSWVYRRAGISIPRTASAQQAAARRVSNPQPGDLVFFGYPAYHVGIYVSPGRLLDAQRPGTTVGNHSIWTTPSGYGRF